MFYRRTINLKNKSGLRAAVALILTAAMLLLCACNDAETPEKAIKRFNKRMNDCDYKAAFNYVKDYDGLSFDSGDKNGTRKIVDAVSKTLEIEIVDIQTSGANGAAVLYVTTCSDVDTNLKHSRRLLECCVVGKIDSYDKNDRRDSDQLFVR